MKNPARKFVSFVSSFALLLQSFTPVALTMTPSPVYAQESTDTVITTEPTPEPTSVPAEPTTTPEPTATPDATPTDVPADPEPTTAPEPTATPTLTVSVQPSPEQTPEPSPTPTESVTMEASVPQDGETVDLDLSTFDYSSATLTTDKADYNPGETAWITGSGLRNSYGYQMTVSSSDEPPTSSTVNVTTDTNGAFTYGYALENIYRPNYSVVLRDGSQTIATASFTDANPSADLDQCENGPYPSPSTNGCDTVAADWVNGNLGESKAVYMEGDSVPYRMRFGNLSLGSHTVIIKWDTTKSGKHALDYLTTFNRTVSTANPCLGVSGCNPASFTTSAIPKDPQVDNGSGSPVSQIAGNFTLYGGSITDVSAYTYPDGSGFAGDKSAQIAVTFSATQANPVLAWGGHISNRSDWGMENSAVSIPGSPYHMRLVDLDGKGGNQDRSLSAAAVIFPGSITVIKQATPESNTVFDYTASPSPLSNFSLTDDGTTANTRVFSDIVDFQTYSVSETTPAGWTLNGISCSVTSANGGSRTVSLPGVAIDLEEGENVTCTFTNEQQLGTLLVKKHVINDNGGTAAASAFSMHVKNGGTDVTGSPAAGSESGTSYTLPAGGYVVSENTPPSGYSMTGISGDCDTNGNVTVVAGQTKTCTVTNDDIAPQLTVIKHVINDNGGTAIAGDFTMNVTATNPSPSSFAGSESGTSVALDAGSYSVGETGPAGYSASYSADCSGSIAVGESKTCTVTNNDQGASLIVIKHVINDNGGTAVAGDFTMNVTGNAPSPSSFAGEESPGTSVSVNAGSYSVGETGPAGYAASFSADCSGSINLGQTKTCTVTNNDVAPHLIVIKHVINDNGGTAAAGDFTMNVTATNPSPASFAGAESPGTDVTLDAGSYSVGESGPSGYAASFSADCTGSIAVGQTKTCTVINNDIAPTLTLIKSVVNDNGGTLGVSDFPLFIDGNGVTSGVTNTVSAGAHTASETQAFGYVASAWGGDCDAQGNVSLSPGQNKTCTIVNDDVAPHLIVIKHVINDNGGTAAAGDFTMNVSATNPSLASFAGSESPGTDITLTAGAYSVGETGPAGYAASFSADCTGSVSVGQTKTCTVTNDDIQPMLKLVKTVINDNGGTLGVADFPLFVGSTQVTSGVFNGFNAGSYTASETTKPGYAASGWGGDCAADGSVTLAIGQTKTCTIVNDDISPRITIVKDAQPNDLADFTFGGTLGTFILDDDAGVQDIGQNGDVNRPQSVTFASLTSADQDVTETVPNQYWVLDGATCVNTSDQTPFASSLNGFTLSVHLPLASDVTCTFVNKKIGLTRTQGFWKTHTSFTSAVFGTYLGGNMPIGATPHKGVITNILAPNSSQLFGGYYASVSMKSTGKGKAAQRTAIDQARMTLLRQLITAKLNCAAFGCPAGIQAVIVLADAAYFAGNVSQMNLYAGQLDTYNNSGDTLVISPPLPNPGQATPKTSELYADIAFWNNP